MLWSLFQGAPHGTALWRADSGDDDRSGGHLVLWAVNSASSTVYGADISGLVGKRMREAFPAELDDASAESLRRIYRAAAFQHPMPSLTIQWRDERVGLVWFDCSYIPVGDRTAAVVFRNVTAERQAQDALQTLHADLERRVAERTEQLRKTNERLELFARVVSHDLKQPLRTIEYFANALAEDLGDGLDDTCRGHVRRVAAGTERLRELIDALYQYATLRDTPPVLAPCDLNVAVQDLLADLATSINESGATVDVGPLPTVQADRRMLGRALHSLVSNAIKFRGDKAPRVVIHGAEDADGHVLTVTDNGIGIEPRFYEAIFQPFRRLHAKGRFAGSGLGLAVARHVVAVHGGALAVEAASGGGSTFTLRLPKRGAR